MAQEDYDRGDRVSTYAVLLNCREVVTGLPTFKQARQEIVRLKQERPENEYPNDRYDVRVHGHDVPLDVLEQG